MNGYDLQTFALDAPETSAAVTAQAERLFGEAVRKRGAQQAIIAATEAGTDEPWHAGILLEIENVPLPEGATEKVASVRLLVVAPAARGRGLAGRMLRRAMELAREHGCARLRSTAGFGCPDHLAMYHRLRFEEAQRWERPYLVTRDVRSA